MLRKLLKIAAALAIAVLVLSAAGLIYLYFHLTRAVLGEATDTPSVLRCAEASTQGSTLPPHEPFDFDPSRFPDPGREFGPMTRWWWPGADVDEAELEREVALLAENGFAGVEIQPFTMGLNAEAESSERERVMSWDSEDYYRKLRGVLDAAAEHGLIVDLNGGSGWPTGGPQIALEDNFLTLLFREARVRGGDEVLIELEPPDPPLSSYLSLALAGTLGAEPRGMHFPDAAQMVAVSAARVVDDQRSRWVWGMDDQVALDPDSAIDLTPNVSGRTLTWTPPEGDWRIVSFWSLPDGEPPALIAKSPAGFVVDHFAADKVRANYDYLFGSRTGLAPYYGKPLRAIFNDSYEFKADRHFTANFLEEFEARRGYDIRPWLPAAMQPGYNHILLHIMAPHAAPDFVFSGEDWRLRYDYDHTLSDLLLEGFLDTSADWMSHRGLQHRTQAYGMPMDAIAAAGRAHIPESEQLYWGGSEAFLKGVSSGAWLYNRPIVTAESVVYMGREYMSTPQKIKISADKALTSGVNQMIYHGTAYRYQAPGLPEEGWYPWSSPFAPLLGFATDLRESNPFWKFVPELNRYIARAQYALRSGRPSVDVLLYYPFLGFVMNGEELNPEELLPRGEFVGVEPPAQPLVFPWSEDPDKRAKSPTQRWLEQVWETINTLEELGVTWAWVNDESLQEAAYEADRWKIRGGEYQAVLLPHAPFVPVETAQHLHALAEQGASIAIIGETPSSQPSFRDYEARDRAVREAFEQVTALDSASSLASAKDLKEWSAPLARVIRYHEPYRHLRQIQRTMSDGGRLAFIRSKKDEWTDIQLDLGPGVRRLTWLDPQDGSRRSGDDGSYRLPPYGAVIAYAGVRAAPSDEAIPQVLDPAGGEIVSSLESWTLSVDGAEPKGVPLGDWRDEAAHQYAAEGLYRTQAELADLDAASRYVLDMGRVSTTAEVTINGKPAGTAIYAPYSIDVTETLQVGMNTIEIRVTAPAINQRIGKAAAGDERYVQFQDKQNMAMPAGLLGPVRVRRAGQSE